MDTQKVAFEGYAILELMGHRRLGGYVRETTLAGAAVLRIDVPKPEAACWTTTDPPTKDETKMSQVYGASALFCLTPCKASFARAVALHAQGIELTYFELKALPPAEREQPEDAQIEIPLDSDDGA